MAISRGSPSRRFAPPRLDLAPWGEFATPKGLSLKSYFSSRSRNSSSHAIARYALGDGGGRRRRRGVPCRGEVVFERTGPRDPRKPQVRSRAPAIALTRALDQQDGGRFRDAACSLPIPSRPRPFAQLAERSGILEIKAATEEDYRYRFSTLGYFTPRCWQGHPDPPNAEDCARTPDGQRCLCTTGIEKAYKEEAPSRAAIPLTYAKKSKKSVGSERQPDELSLAETVQGQEPPLTSPATAASGLERLQGFGVGRKTRYKNVYWFRALAEWKAENLRWEVN